MLGCHAQLAWAARTSVNALTCYLAIPLSRMHAAAAAMLDIAALGRNPALAAAAVALLNTPSGGTGSTPP